ncbi:MAG: hypothetical protein ACFFCZ_24910 [Promethearchaeota archaeon]
MKKIKNIFVIFLISIIILSISAISVMGAYSGLSTVVQYTGAQTPHWPSYSQFWSGPYTITSPTYGSQGWVADFDASVSTLQGIENLAMTGVQSGDDQYNLQLDVFMDGFQRNYEGYCKWHTIEAFIRRLEVRVKLFYETQTQSGSWYWSQRNLNYASWSGWDQFLGGDATADSTWNSLPDADTLETVGQLASTAWDYGRDFAIAHGIANIPVGGWAIQVGLYAFQLYNDLAYYPGALTYTKVNNQYWKFVWEPDVWVDPLNPSDERSANPLAKHLHLDMLVNPPLVQDTRHYFQVEYYVDTCIKEYTYYGDGSHHNDIYPYFSFSTTGLVQTKFYQQHSMTYQEWSDIRWPPSPPPPPGGGCPNLQVWNGVDFTDYGVLDIHNDINPETDTQIAREIGTPTITDGNKMFVRLNEIGAGWDYTESYIDQVQVEFIDDNTGESTFFKLLQAFHSGSEANQKSLVKYDDDVRLQIIKGEFIDLYFKVPKHLDLEGGTFIFHLNGHNAMKL